VKSSRPKWRLAGLLGFIRGPLAPSDIHRSSPKHGGLKQPKSFSPSSKGQRSEVQVSTGPEC
jgi:hypothetical protein